MVVGKKDPTKGCSFWFWIRKSPLFFIEEGAFCEKPTMVAEKTRSFFCHLQHLT
jgi:hypothetical protein